MFATGRVRLGFCSISSYCLHWPPSSLRRTGLPSSDNDCTASAVSEVHRAQYYSNWHDHAAGTGKAGDPPALPDCVQLYSADFPGVASGVPGWRLLELDRPCQAKGHRSGSRILEAGNPFHRCGTGCRFLNILPARVLRNLVMAASRRFIRTTRKSSRSFGQQMAKQF